MAVRRQVHWLAGPCHHVQALLKLYARPSLASLETAGVSVESGPDERMRATRE